MLLRLVGRRFLIGAAAVSAIASLATLAHVPAYARATQAEIAAYQHQLRIYQQARHSFEVEAEAYWTAIADKRRSRIAKRRNGQAITLNDYVLSQPPVYAGPKRPVDPDPQPGPPPVERRPLPVVSDFLEAAAAHYQFQPRRPASEVEFKRAYARVAAAYGLTREQAVRVYAFETGGNGTHDMQSGLSSNRPDARAISTAVGYNQLLTANSVNLMAEQGPNIIAALSQRAARASGAERMVLDRKIAVLKRMVAVARSVPASWSEQQKLAATPPGLGIHAMLLDVDVGPLLQTHKLLTSVVFAQRKGHPNRLTAAELEMMNLTGDGNGFDMVTMPAAMRERVPTSNFFQRSGYERNPVAIRHNTVAKLLAITDERMDVNGQKPGARELAAAFPTAMSSN
ncbi:MAG TPA: hypothetical protein VNZ94_08245 [Xanthobacteraceae bacterium]|nr:hypothetical protein [Xanthobacteraceae bacterium]